MNSKTKQSLSLLFMILLMGLTSYFIFKDQSISSLLQALKT